MIIRPHSQQNIRTNSYNMNRYNPYNLTINQQRILRKKIGDFSFHPEDQIGRGYSSTVYKGINDITNQQVAIKVIQLKSLKDDNSKQFLYNELNCLKSLNHQNLLRFINSYMTSNNCYIITELYSEGDLSILLKRKKSFYEIQILQIFKQFLSGYLYFHNKGFIHRDIKPSNVLISVKNDFVLADFGFIQHSYQNPKHAYNVGTPVYMAPESLTQNTYSVKSDIWSIGIMLFQLAFGMLPFKARAQFGLKHQICNTSLNFDLIQRQTNKYFSKQFINLLDSCLKKSPYQRISIESVKIHSWITTGSYNIANIQTLIDQDLNHNFKNCQQYCQSIANMNFRYSFPQVHFKNSESLNHCLVIQKNSKIKKSYLDEKANVRPNQNKENLSPNMQIQYKLKTIDFLLERQNRKSRQFLQSSRKKQMVSKQKNNKSNAEDHQKIKLIENNNNKLKQTDTLKSKQISIKYPNYKLRITQKKAFKHQFQSKLNLLQGMKSIVDLKKAKKNPIIQTSMHNIEYLDKSFQNKQTMKFKSLQLKKQKINSFYNQTQLSPIQYLIRSIHLLRYIFQIFTACNRLQDSKIIQKNTLDQVKQTLFSYFLYQWQRIQKICLYKRNLFQIQPQKWRLFTNNSKFAVFQNVVKQYKQKFMKQQKFKAYLMQKQFKMKSTYLVQVEIKTKLYDILSRFDKHVSGFTYINQSDEIKKQIQLIFNLSKFFQLLNQQNSLGEKIYLKKNNLKKLLSQLQGKEESFKISKMIIELKKKYYEMQGQIFSQC